MSEEALRAHAESFLRAASCHTSCRSTEILEVTDAYALMELGIAVELPLHMKVDGHSPNGVRTEEPVQVRIRQRYPWTSPTIYLRADFPRDLPHLQPGPASALPRPCLVDGDQSEFFIQFGLAEFGTYHLIDQLVRWLSKAAEGTLIDRRQGWEPILRREISDFITMDAQHCREHVRKKGGREVFEAKYYRPGKNDAELLAGASVYMHVGMKKVPMKATDMKLFTSTPKEAFSYGNTVGCIIWADALPNGAPFVSDSYLPETVENYGQLITRAKELRCDRPLIGFIDSLERCFKGYVFARPIPIAVIFCVRRPFNVIGVQSDLELIPYLIEFQASQGRTTLIANGAAQVVAPAMQRDVANAKLLREVSGAVQVDPITILGCGSVGSKIAMHLARSGVQIDLLSDHAMFRPHNMTRHALVRDPMAYSKATELQKELRLLGSTPKIHEDDIVEELETKKGRRLLLSKSSACVINTTASLGVREALSNVNANDLKSRLMEAALFGRGNGAFLLTEGVAHNPTLNDLAAELYASAPEGRLHSLLFDPEYGLKEVQIGQGCGSLTMPMTDMRVSAMTAIMSELVHASLQEIDDVGTIDVGISEENAPTTIWHQQRVSPFHIVQIPSSGGWTLRISQRVLDQIDGDIAQYKGLETGGVLMGMCSARLKAVTVVDLVAAPQDSKRSPTRFTLGTDGLAQAIEFRHQNSGGALFDVGTWHSHLSNTGSSQLDRSTAEQLAAERPPPSILLIVTPENLYGLM